MTRNRPYDGHKLVQTYPVAPLTSALKHAQNTIRRYLADRATLADLREALGIAVSETANAQLAKHYAEQDAAMEEMALDVIQKKAEARYAEHDDA